MLYNHIMIRITCALIDDDVHDRSVLEECASIVFGHADCYDSVNAFYNAGRSYELVLLDINLGSEDGIGDVRKVAEKTEIIVFVTNLPGRVWEAFAPKVAGFLLKREGKTKIINELHRISSLYLGEDIELDTSRGILRLRPSQLEALYLDHRQVFALLVNGSVLRMKNRTISQYEEQYKGLLKRVNSYQLINISQISRLVSYDCITASGHTYKIGRKWLKDIRDAYAGRLL